MKLLTVEEAAETLHLSTWAVRRHYREGRFGSCYRPGKRILFTEANILTYLESTPEPVQKTEYKPRKRREVHPL